MASIQKISIDGVEYDIAPKVIESTANWWEISFLGVECNSIAQAALVAGITTAELESILSGDYSLPFKISRQIDTSAIESGGTMPYEVILPFLAREKTIQVEQYEPEDQDAEYVTSYRTYVVFGRNYSIDGVTSIGFVMLQDESEEVYSVTVYGFLNDDPYE